MRVAILIASILYSTLLGVLPGQAQHRVALIIGNSAYRNVSHLNNPANDARTMAETLRGLGFALVGGGPQIDLDKRGLERTVQAFGEAATNADVALFYFAGHGIEVRGTNYLLPVDAKLNREADVDFDMLNVNLVLRQMEDAHTRLNVVILDACRNNPFGGRGFRAIGRGLAAMESPDGTLIAFATEPGNVAVDEGGEGNSPYTKALAAILRKPGVGLFDAFNQTGLAVREATGGAQRPWFSSSSISGSFYFAGPPASDPAADEIVWNALKDTSDVAALRRFLNLYPSSGLLDDARTRIATLEASAEDRIAREETERKKAKVDQNIQTVMLPSREERPSEMSGGALIIEIKRELKRVGCYAGRIDDQWGTAEVKSAIRKFLGRTNLAEAPEGPTLDFRDAVRSRSSRTCPLECSRREIERDGRCVAKSCPNGLALGADGACEMPTVRSRTTSPPPKKEIAPVSSSFFTCSQRRSDCVAGSSSRGEGTGDCHAAYQACMATGTWHSHGPHGRYLTGVARR